MQFKIYKTYDELSRSTADFICDYVNQKPDAVLSLPSGESPTGTFGYLVEYARTGKVDFSRCTFIGLDEWVGMDENDEGSCRHYMNTHLFTPLGLDPAKILFFNARAHNLEEECNRVDRFIQQHGPLDIMLVGIGMNGHIGLNEPGVAFDLYSHRTALDSVTKAVGQKYFKQETTLQEGITLGLRHLQEARVAILLAAGAHKAAIVAKALEGEVTNQVPASILQILTNSFVFLDQEAASGLSSAAHA